MASRVTVNRNIGTLHTAVRPTANAVKDGAAAADVVYRRLEKELFASEGASGGAPWLHLSPKYLAWKQNQRALDRAANRKRIAKARKTGKALKQQTATSTRILVLTGTMRAAFSEDGPDHIARGFILPSGARIQMGAQGPAFYAMHADGRPPGAGEGGRPPQRDPQQRTPEQNQEILNAIRDAFVPHILAALRAKVMSGMPGGSLA